MQDYNWEIGTDVIGGYITGKQQIRQWIQRVLSTERNMYPQYSSNYGIEFDHLRNQRFEVIGVQLRETIRSALQQHPEIIDISHYTYERVPNVPDAMLIRFVVHTSYGNLTYQTVKENI